MRRVDLKLIDTSVKFTHGNYAAAISTLFEGAILAVIMQLPPTKQVLATQQFRSRYLVRLLERLPI